MKCIWAVFILYSGLFYGCQHSDNWIELNTDDTLSFGGYYATKAYAGQIELYIENGHFECLSGSLNGKSAGRVETDKTTIEFIDTSAFANSPIYGTAFVLLGKYIYLYDGKNLKIERNMNGSVIKYELVAKKIN
jgi:hypothetical protein